jgi:lipopolysaccharide biosynthesis protein
VGTTRVAGFPGSWRTSPGIRITDPARIAVVVHVHVPERLRPVLDQLRHIPVDYDLIVTNSSGTPVTIEGDLGRLRDHRVLDVADHGRDVWPTVAVVNSGLLDPYLLILKIRTERDEWRPAAAARRAGSLDPLLGDHDNVSDILGAFREDPSLGIVTADGSVSGPGSWGDNRWNTRELARRLEFDVEDADLRFPAGPAYWCRGIVLQGLRALSLSHLDFEPETGQADATVAHAVERLVGIVTTEAGLVTAERSGVHAAPGSVSWQGLDGRPLAPRVRFVPFYLPDFHPTPENDRWWGAGSTEWTDVTAARPNYHGHHQPRLPQDLGFYDLRLDETRAAQAELASSAGIEGFMYHYYWFAGRRLMSRPIEQLLHGDLQFPFCILWANEDWTRSRDGDPSDVLMAQDHERVPAAHFLEDVAEFLADPRYITVDGRKVLAVHRPEQLPDFPAVAREWRAIARRRGVGELYLLRADLGGLMEGIEEEAADSGLDGSLAFPPHNHLWSWVDGESIGVRPGFTGNGLRYDDLVEDSVLRAWSDLDPDHYPGAMVTFDDTARRQDASDFWYGSNPYRFRRWLCALATAVGHRDRDHRMVFVNAWNQWGQAAVLEPTQRHGRSYLLALRDVALN